jgi:primase-polymerase (primpol)-like protein
MNDTGATDATDTAPRTFNGDLTALPAALRPLSQKDQWVLWLWTKSDTGKLTKPPLQARFPDRRAKNNDPATWSSHAEAAHAVQKGLGDGIGFVLTGTEFAAIDLDHCRDPETGAIDAWAQAIIDQASDAYIEITVSGSGLRVVGTATLQSTAAQSPTPLLKPTSSSASAASTT